MLATSQSNGAPVWVTVLCARVIGGFAVGFLSYFVLAAAKPGAVRSASWNDALTFVPAVIGALVTGLAITCCCRRSRAAGSASGTRSWLPLPAR